MVTIAFTTSHDAIAATVGIKMTHTGNLLIHILIQVLKQKLKKLVSLEQMAHGKEHQQEIQLKLETGSKLWKLRTPPPKKNHVFRFYPVGFRSHGRVSCHDRHTERDVSEISNR